MSLNVINSTEPLALFLLSQGQVTEVMIYMLN